MNEDMLGCKKIGAEGLREAARPIRPFWKKECKFGADYDN
jgi:hypothetical protein